MAEAGTIPERLYTDRHRTQAMIPFHQGELLRVEIGRTTLVDVKPIPPARYSLERIPVRARHCNVLVNRRRLRGVQCIVVVDKPEISGEHLRMARIVGIVVKTRRDEPKADIEWLRGLAPIDVVLVHVTVEHPDTGESLFELGVGNCRILEHPWLGDEEEADDPPFIQFDFIG